MALSIQARRLRVFFAVCFLVLGGLAAPSPAAANPGEYELKAVMLFNLARFVEWPARAFADSSSPIVIGILGRDPFGNILDTAVRGETVNGRRIVVERFATVRALRPCHILFVSSSEKPRVGLILAKLKGQPTLSVSELDGFSKLPGGMVRFYTNDQKKIRLRLNLESAKAAGLDVSSQLIQVAELEKTSLLAPPFGPAVAFEPAPRSGGRPFPERAR